MLVPGAIAATCAARVMNTPALPACAPPGPTQASTGTRERKKAATTIRVESNEPPGVSISTSSASCPDCWARSTQSTRYAAEPASTVPLSSQRPTTSPDASTPQTWPAGGRAITRSNANSQDAWVGMAAGILARIAIPTRHSVRRYAESVKQRKDVREREVANRMGEKPTTGNANRCGQDFDSTERAQPFGKHQILHQGLLGKPLQSLEDLLSHEDRLVSVWQARVARTQVRQMEEELERGAALGHGPGAKRAAHHAWLHQCAGNQPGPLGRKLDIGVEKEKNVAGRDLRPSIHLVRSPSCRLEDLDFAILTCQLHGTIGARAVHDNDLGVPDARPEASETGFDCSLLVEDRNDHRKPQPLVSIRVKLSHDQGPGRAQCEARGRLAAQSASLSDADHRFDRHRTMHRAPRYAVPSF